MNLQEFAALKVGDAIEHGMTGSRGEVIETTAGGVRVRWNGAGLPFDYSAQSTAWFHWCKPEQEDKNIC